MRGLFFAIAAVPALLVGACGDKEPRSMMGPVAIVASEEPGADETRNAPPVIVILGDSLTAGYELPADAALPAALQRDFDEQGVKARFVNAGVSGDTTADGLQRYDWSVTGANADLLVIALGANDFLQNLPAETARKNLAAILDRAKKDHLPAALIGVTIPGEAQDEREASYAAIYPDLAARYDVPYFPNMLGAIAGQPELLMQDGLHPTAEGVEAMAQQLTGFLTPLVEDLS